MRKIAMPVPYDEKTVIYTYPDDERMDKDGENHLRISGRTNQLTWDLMKDRFVVLRNFIPKDVINLSLDTWKTIEHNGAWDEAIFKREHEITQNSPKDSLGKSKANYCTPMAVSLHRWLKEKLDNVIDMGLRETYSYTRKYERGAYLRAHTDRPSCEISATICLDYKTDDNAPWKIWVQNDDNYVDMGCMDEVYDISQGISHRNRRGIPISLEPGDVLLYQGPNVIHWRDYLVGDYSYHIFLHFFNEDSKLLNIDKMHTDMEDHFALSFDGRPHRYADETYNVETGVYNDAETGKTKKRFKEFANIYHNVVDKKANFANNYDDFELDTRKKRAVKE